jgi:probable phosphoglycerate mutase
VRRRIYLLRHGEVQYFDEGGRPRHPEDAGLTDEGREQATAVALALGDAQFDRVITSGLARTVQTARIIAPSAREVEEWPELEEWRGGRLEDIPDEELEAAFTYAFRGVVPADARFLGGETTREFVGRVIPALERILEDESWDTLLLVLHGGVNRAILSYALTGERVFLGNFEQSAGCINVLDVDADRWIVRAVNVTPLDVVHKGGRHTTMERYLQEYLPYRRSKV